MLLRTFFIMLLLSMLITSAPAVASDALNEYQVKAAYLYNFAKFITWPDENHKHKSPFVIGVLGKNAFGQALEQLTAKTIRNRPIIIKYFKTIEDVANCQILYLASTEHGKIKKQLGKLTTQPIVTISDANNFARSGGIIQLIRLRGRINFIINLEQARNVDLKFESQLLSLATKVLEAKN